MTELPYIPQNPIQFVQLMEEIWDGNCTANPDGGVTCFRSYWYDDWHNARRVVHELRLVRTGGGQDYAVYRFPDKSGVAVANNGSFCYVAPNKFGAKKRHMEVKS